MKECCKDILAFNPDVVILIDYPGFNMKIAKFAKKHGFKVFYYIAPKVWAWKERRVHKIKRFVDKLFIIFPFEVEYFRKWGIETVYRGNPLLDSVCNFSHAGESRAAFEARTSPKRQVICTTATEPATAAAAMPIIAALAGSRKMEIGFLLPRIVRTALAMPQYRFIIAAAPSMEPEYLKKIIQKELAAAGAPAGRATTKRNRASATPKRASATPKRAAATPRRAAATPKRADAT